MWGRETGSRRRRRGRALLIGFALVLASAGTAYALDLTIDTEGHTTLEQILQGSGGNFETLSVEVVNEDYIVRAPDPQAQAQNDREDRRVSLAYFSQLTDFQLADEESPARVEFADPGASSAWRPMEAFHPFLIDASIRQVNRFAPSSPVPQGIGISPVGRPMDFALITGDQADNNQRNEMIWTRQLIEGGAATDFGSGVESASFYDPTPTSDFASKPSCGTYFLQELATHGTVAATQAAIAAEATGYTGVQDFDDYPASPPPQPAYYDPDVDATSGPFADFPMYPGLMDQAQTWSFTPAGLDVPSYWSNGNHDILVQGNEDANAAFEDIATACFKALGTTQALPPSSPGPDFSPDPNLLLFPASVGMLVPPDPLRRFVDRPQIKAVIGANNEDNDHGFDFVSAAQNTASAGTASYYAWNPSQTPGFRFINVDTNSEGGQTAEGVASGSSNGNIDDPQFQWLKQELDAAQVADKLIVLFGHHPVRSMTTEIADEQAGPCTPPDHSHPGDSPQHNHNPGCDRDPRASTPVHLGQDPVPGDPRQSFVELLQNYPNVIAYVAGHTHEHRLIPFTRPSGSVWWEINTSATADWPQQHRLIEVMDNHDGTLSIFGTVLDAASPAGIPDPGSATGFDENDLSSIGRTLAFNDPQGGPPSGEGQPIDRNVEMLLADPREANLLVTKADSPDPVVVGNTLTYTLTVTNSGPSTATATTLTDHLPPTVDFDTAAPSQGACPDPVGNELTCALGDIPVDGTVTVTVTVTPQTSGTITNGVEVDSALADPQPANNSDEEPTLVNPAAGPPADLAISKSAPATLTLGQQLTWDISVTNNGPADPAPDVAVTDPLPNGVNFVSASTSQGPGCSTSSGDVVCEFGDMADGASATAQIVVAPQSAGTIVNNATVASGRSDPLPANNSDSATTQVTSPSSGGAAGAAGGGGKCRGQASTIAGTAGAETITGTAGPDVIVGLRGADRINGKGGNDLICGGKGRDRIGGGQGDDFVHGERGPDRIKGKSGDDTLFGNFGKDLLKGNKGDDLCAGGAGRDLIASSCE